MLIRELLKTNAGCVLPCWWGITPGKSTWPETERFIISVGANTSSNSDPDGTIIHETGGFDLSDQGIYNRISFSERSGIVEAIHVDAEGRYDPPGFKSIWENYSPGKVISSYGQPTRVWLKTFASARESPQSSTMVYSFWLFYDERGFLVRYSGLVQFEPVYHMCPTFGEYGDLSPDIEIHVQSPSNPNSLEELVDVKIGSQSSIRTFEDATGMSLKELHSLFVQGDSPICFDTPRSLWP